MRRIVRLVDRSVDALELLAGILMVLLTVIVTVAVISRYFLDLPIRATTEGSGLIFAWLVFLAAISVTHKEDNIAVTYFRERLPDVLQRVGVIAMKVLMIVFSCYMAYSSVLLAMAVADQEMPVLRISSAWLNGSVAVAFVGIALVLALQIVVELFFPDIRGEARKDELGDGEERMGAFE